MSTIKRRVDRLEATPDQQLPLVIVIRSFVTEGQPEAEATRAQFGGQTFERCADESESEFLGRVKAAKGGLPGAILAFAE